MLRNRQNLTHAQELVQLRTGRPLPDLLHDLYVVQGRSLESIATELGTRRQTVAMWLREFGVKRPEAVA